MRRPTLTTIQLTDGEDLKPFKVAVVLNLRPLNDADQKQSQSQPPHIYGDDSSVIANATKRLTHRMPIVF